jgi:hypothetical protein
MSCYPAYLKATKSADLLFPILPTILFLIPTADFGVSGEDFFKSGGDELKNKFGRKAKTVGINGL